jgi:hypothetical protein
MAMATVMRTAAATAMATVMATGNAVLPLLRDLATTITTMTANEHLAGDAMVGAFGILNDGDNIGGKSRRGDFDKEDALVLTAEAVAALLVDDTKVAIWCCLVGGAFEDAVAREGTAGGVGWVQQ